jgi:hypothetical protein
MLHPPGCTQLHPVQITVLTAFFCFFLIVSSLDLAHGGGADERNDVSAQYPDVVRELTALLIAFNNSAVSSALQGMPDDPRQNPKLHNGTVLPWM